MSIITNNTNQPSFVWRAGREKNSSHKHMGKDEFSVTMLKKSVTALVLTKRHYDAIVLDLQDIADSLMGTLTHEGLEPYAKEDGYLTEQELEYTIDLGEGKSFRLYGKMDMFRPSDADLIDWKNTKEAMFNKSRDGQDDDWKFQLTMYNVLLDLVRPRYYHGLKKMGIEAYLKDLSVVTNYNKGISTDKLRYLPYKVPTEKEKSDTLDECIALVHAYNLLENTNDDDLPLCPDDYRWAEKVWKIYKGTSDKHNKSAERGHANYKSLEEAQEGFKKAGFTEKDHVILEVGGESIRCKFFCDCRSVCPHAKKMFGGK